MAVWIIWFVFTRPQSWQIIHQNWPVTVTMIAGSLIAGATSEGGGAIAFPIFTKVLHIAPLEAKIFSLAIQSVGMIAATLTIIWMRLTVDWRLIGWASAGGLLGVAVGTAVIAPLLPPELLKMLFTAMIFSFAITLSLLNWKKRLYNNRLMAFSWREKLIVVSAGCVGGCMTGLVGNGIDMICFSVMVLLFRMSEKISTPTSVILMAFNSLAGFLLHLFVIGGVTETVLNYWLAAIPVVVIGAPVGAYYCTRMSNNSIAALLIFLIIIELISSLMLIPLTGPIIGISLGSFLLFSFMYFKMSRVTRYCPVEEENE